MFSQVGSPEIHPVCSIVKRMEIGDVIQNRYRLEAELGQGGMGMVYRGHDLLLDRLVAIKILAQGGLGTEGRVRLLNEARAVARLSHPHIVAVYDAGETDVNGVPGAGRILSEVEGRSAPTTTGPVPYIVMQYVAGRSLHSWVEQGKPRPVEDVLEVARQLCAALDHAHASGVIHRDLKPENVLLGEDGLARLTDFGLARSVASRLTVEGAIIGTVFYLPPELALGQPYDGRADLYSLGVMLYELLAGRLPFIADDPIGVISQHLYAPVVPPSTYNSRISPALDAVILRLMSKDPRDRPASAEAVRQALMRLEAPVVAEMVEAVLPLERIARGRMVGRVKELAEVQRLWRSAAAGQGQVLLISGEPGIGKTRLVRELSARVEISGGAALAASCYAESGAPYAPVALIIRSAFTIEDKPDSQKLIPLDLPEATLDALGMLAPDCCGQPRELRDRPELDPHADQERLFDSLVELFQALTRRAPLLIVFEDVHWADSGTLSMVRRLSRHVPAMPMLLVLTYREVELGESRVLSDLLYELSRQRLGERIKLTRLSRGETGELLASMFAEQPGPQLVDLIFRETEGNLFFIEEVCKALVDEGRISHHSGRWQAASLAELGIPQSVRMAIEARVGRLPDSAQEALRLAAVFGREFDFEALHLVSQVSGDDGTADSEESLIDGLEAASRAQLIAEAPLHSGGRRPSERAASGRLVYSFTHALIPSALLGEMSTMRRQRLHRRAGLALERLSAERPVEYPREDLAPQLSRHFIEAGDHAKALDYLLLVGDRARQLFAYPEAIEAYEQAQEFLKEQGQYDTAARTLMKLGLVYHLVYDFPRSRQAYQNGFNLWQLAASHTSTDAGLVSKEPAKRPIRIPGSTPRTLDPARVSDVESGDYTFQLFEGLAELTPDGNVVPSSAHSWDVLEGGKRYVFRLRQDARWSDGVPLTAHDFAFAWRRTLHPATVSPNASLLFDVRGARRFHSGDNTNPDSLGVSAPDDLTLVVELNEPVGYFLHLLTHYAAFPVPRHAVEAYGDEWIAVERLVCNGPFVLAGWQPGVSVTMVRNPNYSGRFFGNLQAIELDLANKPERFLERYEANELDFVGLGAEFVERMRYRYPGEYLSAPTLGLSFIGFNQAYPPLDDVRVRRALVHATDRQALVDLLAPGYPTPVPGGFLPPGIPGHSPEVGLEYNPGLARDLFAQAGYPGGQGFPELNLYLFGSKGSDRMGDLISHGWRETLGITLHHQHTDLIENFHTINLAGLWHVTWIADYPDADNFLRVALGHYQVLKYWNNPEFNRLVEEARRCLEPQQRSQMYRDADRLLTEGAVLMPLSYFRRHTLIKPWVKNFHPGMQHFYYLKDVILDL